MSEKRDSSEVVGLRIDDQDPVAAPDITDEEADEGDDGGDPKAEADIPDDYDDESPDSADERHSMNPNA